MNTEKNTMHLVELGEAANDSLHSPDSSKDNLTIHSGEIPLELTKVAEAVKTVYLDTNNSIRDVINGQAEAIESVIGLALDLAEQRKNSQKNVVNAVLGQGENPVAMGLPYDTYKQMEELTQLLEGASNDDNFALAS